jgi:multiple sugar transport system permease protein
MNTLQLGLSVFQQRFTTQWNLLMAATMTATIPVLILFLMAQRTFTEGIALSGLKT